MAKGNIACAGKEERQAKLLKYLSRKKNRLRKKEVCKGYDLSRQIGIIKLHAQPLLAKVGVYQGHRIVL